MRKSMLVPLEALVCFVVILGALASLDIGVPGEMVVRSAQSAPQGLVEGAVAYVRIKEYTTQLQEDVVPKGAEMKLAFGEAITLTQKNDGLPTFWMGQRGKEKAWIPAYLLTPNMKEIEFLKKNDKVPETMTFVYESAGEIRLYGQARLGPVIVDSQGLSASSAGSRQVAFARNAVLFDDSAMKHKWSNPIVMNDGKMTFAVSAGRMYYCTQVDDKGKGTFVCINLQALCFCKD